MCLAVLAAIAMSTAEVQVDEITVEGVATSRGGEQFSESHVYAMSDDGQVVVGTGTTGGWSAFRWTKTTGVRALPVPDGMQKIMMRTSASDISGDGQTIVGDGVWLGPGSALLKKFNRAALSVADLAKLPLTESTAAKTNRDGSVMAIEVRGPSATKLFIWRLGTPGAKVIVDRARRRVYGAVLDLSQDGSTVVGIRHADIPAAFAISNGTYLDVKRPPGYPQSNLVAVTADGKVAFGNFSNDRSTQGFRWRIGRSPELLAAGFAVGVATPDGSVLGGQRGEEPALLVGRKIIPLKTIVGDRLGEEAMKSLRIAAITRQQDLLYVLADAREDAIDYRITIPLRSLPVRA